MVDMALMQKALDSLVIMNTAIKNMRLYPPTSASIINSIEKLHQAFLDIFFTEASLVFAESEKALLICGDPLSRKDQEKHHVAAFLEMLLGFGIRSITFDKGLEKEELAVFLEILGKKPEAVKADGGLPQIIIQKNISHIQLDQKVYVARDKNQQILSSLEITDDQIMQFVARANPQLAADSQQILEIARNPEWLMQAFMTGVNQTMAQKGTLTNLQLTENVLDMIVLLDKAASQMDRQDRDQIAKYIGNSLVSLDLDISEKNIMDNIRDLFGGALMQFIMARLEEKSSVGPPAGESAGMLNAGPAAEGQKVIHQSLPFPLDEKFALLLKNDERAFLDVQLMAALHKIFERVSDQNDQESKEIIVDRLGSNLSNENIEVRNQASIALAEILASLPPERQSELVARLSDPLTDWMKLEKLATPAFEKICTSLKDLAQDLIDNGRLEESVPVLNMINDMNTGVLEKDETIQAMSAEIVQSLASEKNLHRLSHEYSTNEPTKQAEAVGILAKLGDTALNHLLDMLRDHHDSNERVRIMQLIMGVGSAAISVVRDRIDRKEPWYYLRNLAYMLGRIGDEKSAHYLKPLLLSEDNRVRLEALKGISRTGGKERGPLLLSILPDVDDVFALNIIETLGNAKCMDAVPDLLNMLKNFPFEGSTVRADLEERICIALGAIGSPEAVPALSEIAGTKYFFRIRSYPDKVKNAASRAVASIRKEHPEAGKGKFSIL